jgi:hypothetical protein
MLALHPQYIVDETQAQENTNADIEVTIVKISKNVICYYQLVEAFYKGTS